MGSGAVKGEANAATVPNQFMNDKNSFLSTPHKIPATDSPSDKVKENLELQVGLPNQPRADLGGFSGNPLVRQIFTSQGNFGNRVPTTHELLALQNTTTLTHNLIPPHLQTEMQRLQQLQQQQLQQQQQTWALQQLYPHGVLASPALIHPLPQVQVQVPLTVQDRPHVPPVFNGVNPNYPGVRMIHSSPPIFTVDNFLTTEECHFLIHSATDSFGPAPVVGKGAGELSKSRTSSTCYLAREDLPEYMMKVTALTGKPMEHCELPQVGRYLPSQQYLQHFDAFDLSNEDGRRFASNGGQRTVTVLVYLNDVSRGGQTAFPSLNIEVQPKQGMALVFFPATVDGYLDKMALHAALPAVDPKYVSQVWIRQGNYEGQPSKRIHPHQQQMAQQLGVSSSPQHQDLSHQQRHLHLSQWNKSESSHLSK